MKRNISNNNNRNIDSCNDKPNAVAACRIRIGAMMGIRSEF